MLHCISIYCSKISYGALKSKDAVLTFLEQEIRCKPRGATNSSELLWLGIGLVKLQHSPNLWRTRTPTNQIVQLFLLRTHVLVVLRAVRSTLTLLQIFTVPGICKIVLYLQQFQQHYKAFDFFMRCRFCSIELDQLWRHIICAATTHHDQLACW